MSLKRVIIKRILISFCYLSFALQAMAYLVTETKKYDFIVDGIPYRIINDHEVAVCPEVFICDYMTHENYYVTQSETSVKGDIVIPPFVNGYEVTSIDQLAFCNFYSKLDLYQREPTIKCEITSISIPSTVKTINASAFIGSKDLKAVYYDDLYSASMIRFEDDYIYDSSIKNFTSNYSPGVFKSKHKVFINGEELSDLVIPEGVTRIGRAFANCDSWKTLTIPPSVEEIEYCAFVGCDSISQVLFNSNAKCVAPAMEWGLNDRFNFFTIFDSKSSKTIFFGDSVVSI